MPTDTHKIVIFTDKTPSGQHVRRYNAPTIDEVAIVMVDDQFLLRYIFFISEMLRWWELRKLIDATIPYNILSFFGMEPTAITLILNW